MRVFFSSLRCFFFAIRLRRFLMTEPTFHLSRTGHTACAGMTAQGYSDSRTRCPASCSDRPDTRKSSAGLEVGPPEIFIHSRLGNAEGPPDPSCRKLAGMNQPVDRHIRNSHGGSHLGDRQELDIGDRLISGPVSGHLAPTFRPVAYSGFPTGALSHRLGVSVVPSVACGEEVAEGARRTVGA